MLSIPFTKLLNYYLNAIVTILLFERGRINRDVLHRDGNGKAILLLMVLNNRHDGPLLAICDIFHRNYARVFRF